MLLILNLDELPFTQSTSFPEQESSIGLDIINLPPIGHFLHSLLQQGKLWKLNQTDCIVMCHYIDESNQVYYYK